MGTGTGSRGQQDQQRQLEEALEVILPGVQTEMCMLGKGGPERGQWVEKTGSRVPGRNRESLGRNPAS